MVTVRARASWYLQLVRPVMYAPVNSTRRRAGPPMPIPRSATFMSFLMPMCRANTCSQKPIERRNDHPLRTGAMWNASPHPYSRKSVVSVK